MHLHERLWVDGPDLGKDGWPWWSVKLEHADDEFGNCSISLKTALFHVAVFPGLCFQRKVELPEPGENEWVDAMYWEPYMDAEEMERCRDAAFRRKSEAAAAERDGCGDVGDELG
jgi:hypothetical protein